ncbi:MAG TPA: hypothetical protein VH643_10435 [Gemmataceae bacterium]
MRNMLALFAAALLTVIGLGWYLGWYKVSSQPASVPGQHSVQIDIDTHKIGNDLEQGEQKLEKMIKEKKDEAKKRSDTAKDAGSLMLPTAPKSSQLNVDTGNGTSLKLDNGANGPLFQFQTNKGQSVQIGGDKGTSIQFGNEKGGPFIQIGGGEKK